MSAAVRIEQAALELFGERGLAGVSVRDLARRAGATVGSISYYYGSKEALYRHCVEILVREFVDDVSEVTVEGKWFPGRVDDARTLRLRRLARMWVDLQMTREEELRRFGRERLLRPVWEALRTAYRRGRPERAEDLGDLFGYLGSVLLGAILKDEQLEHLSGVSAGEARARWSAILQEILAGQARDFVVAEALRAAAAAADSDEPSGA